MATGYVINIGNASVKQWVQFNYEHTLNGMSLGQIAMDGVTTTYTAEYDVDSEIYIYKNGTVVFRGIVVDQQSMTGGGLVLSFNGIELELADNKCPMSAGTDTVRQFNSTGANTIFSTLIGGASGWTANTSNSTNTSLTSFRVSATESIWNAVMRLVELTGKDIYVDQENKTIYLYDELTSTSKTFAFVEGKNAKNIRRKKSRSKAGKVLVYGKGDGEFQITGSHGSSTPVHTIIDRNITTTTEATTRATAEYNRINSAPTTYMVQPTYINQALRLGDAGDLVNSSIGLDTEVDITRIKYLVDGTGTEKIDIEVTNPTYRIASKNSAEIINKQQANYDQSQSAMQGSGNVATWGSGINANSSASLKIGFYISDTIFQDEAGNLRIKSLTLDYDIDPYNKQVGVASFDGGDVPVQDTSGNTQPSMSGDTGSDAPNVSGTTANSNIDTDYDVEVNSVVGGGNNSFTEILPSVVGACDYVIFHFYLDVAKTSSNSGYGIKIENISTSTTYFNFSGFCTDYNHYSGIIVVGSDIESDSIKMTITDNSGSGDDYCHGLNSALVAEHDHSGTGLAANSHDHTATGLVVANHGHPAGGYDVSATALNNISIGDSISESVSINATQANIYLDYWNGSTWVNKHSILATGTTIDTDVDITNGGTYPDAVGYWRVRILTDNASPDYVQGIVKAKFHLDD